MGNYWLNVVKELCAKLGRTDLDPRHVRAYMMDGIRTWSNATNRELRRECRIAIGCVDEAGVEAAERAAKSWGL